MPTKKNTEAYLLKRREQKKLSMQRAREKMKTDNPEKYEEEKKKDRDRKKVGRKSINEMTDREKRKMRKGWKKCSQAYRDRLKKCGDFERILNDTPPHSPMPDLDVLPEASKLQNKVGKYRQRLHRLKKGTACDLTPRKKVYELLKGQKCSRVVRKQLLFSEVLQMQVRTNFSKERKLCQKRLMAKYLSGKVVKKYRLSHKVAFLTSYRTQISSSLKHNSEVRLVRKEDLLKKVKLRQDVIHFLEEDENSRQCPGKKDTITRSKTKMQKRELSDSLKNLHLKFVSCYEEHNKLSYSHFCRLRPFWVVIPHCRSRETCLCKIHTNMNLVVSKLNKVNIIRERTTEELLKSITCEGDILQEKCLEGNCTVCKGRKVKFLEYIEEDSVTLYQWTNKKVEVQVKGKKKICKKTTKEEIICSKKKLIILFNNMLDKFVQHVTNILHQHRIVRQIKNAKQE